MNSRELQSGYGEAPTPMVELAVRRLRTMMHQYLNAPAELPVYSAEYVVVEGATDAA